VRITTDQSNDGDYEAVPAEPLWAIFTPEVLSRLNRISNPSPDLTFRLAVLAAGGLASHNLRGRALRARKSAWEVYLVAAFACGLFEGEHGAELRARLAGGDDNNFRSAMSECFAAWYLAGKRKLRVLSRPEGRPGHPLELLIKLPDADVNVEVKAPLRRITEDFWWGDDSDALQSVLETANRQFEAGKRNLLVVVPSLRLDVLDVRDAIERAFIGETVIQIPIDTRTGGPAGPPTFPFRESGNFAKKWREGPRDNSQFVPRFTRVSAAIFLSEYDAGSEVKHRALIVHNPNAVAPLPADLFDGIPALVSHGGRWTWSDRVEAGAEAAGGPSLAELIELVKPGQIGSPTQPNLIRVFGIFCGRFDETRKRFRPSEFHPEPSVIAPPGMILSGPTPRLRAIWSEVCAKALQVRLLKLLCAAKA
jgi:hypothetical protein